MEDPFFDCCGSVHSDEEEVEEEEKEEDDDDGGGGLSTTSATSDAIIDGDGVDEDDDASPFLSSSFGDEDGFNNVDAWADRKLRLRLPTLAEEQEEEQEKEEEEEYEERLEEERETEREETLFRNNLNEKRNEIDRVMRECEKQQQQ